MLPLRPVQVAMRNTMLEHDRCAIWCPMGGGKTRATLENLYGRWLLGDFEKVLILGQLRVAQSVWPEEAKLWTPEFPVEFIGVESPEDDVKGIDYRREKAWYSTAPAHSIHYELLPELVAGWGNDWPYDAIVADEATRLRGFRLQKGGIRTAALAKVAW